LRADGRRPSTRWKGRGPRWMRRRCDVVADEDDTGTEDWAEKRRAARKYKPKEADAAASMVAVR
jgi:hypothetical protein